MRPRVSSARPSHVSRGFLYMAAAAFFFSIMSLFVKRAGVRLPSAEMVLARGVVTLVLSYGLLRARGASVWGRRRGLLVLRGLAGFGGLSCFYYALTHLPMAEATVIQYTNPVLTAVGAALFLSERARWTLWVSIALSLSGVLLVTRPEALFGAGGAFGVDSAALDPTAVAVAMGGAVCSAIAYVTVRKLGESEDPLTIIFYFPVVAVPATLPFVLPVWVWPTPFEWLLLLGVGVSTQIAQVFLTRGLQLERAGRATAVGYLQVALAAAWGFLWFGEKPDVVTWGGTALVVVGVLMLAKREA
jgi:drug/metabolite transporter (DMT)-like permease